MGIGNLLRGEKDLIGLDIGSSHVKCIELEHSDGGYSIVSASVSEILRSDMGAPRSIDDIVAAINRCVKSSGKTTKFSVCSVCGPEVAVRGFRFPKLNEKDLAVEVIFEAEQVCPFESGQFVLDHQVLNVGLSEEDKDDETNGFLVAATRNLVSSQMVILRKAAVNCVLIDVNGLALLNCFRETGESESGRTVGLLDIGSSYINLVITNDDVMPFVRDIPHAGEEIIGNIAKDEGIKAAEVRSILSSGSPLSDRFYRNLELATMDISAEIRDTLRYYTMQEGGVVDKIYLCGGFSQTPGFVEIMSDSLSCETVLWNPFESLPTKGLKRKKCNEVIAQHGPSLALAAGLAMRKL